MQSRARRFGAVLTVLGLGLLAATVPFWIWPIDLDLQELFFDPRAGVDPWLGERARLCTLLYAYGTLPAYAVAIGSAAVFLASFRVPAWVRWRRPTAYLALCLIVGPGLIVNAALKEHWGRPRPDEVQQFGGKHAFERVWIRDATSSGTSFPSGHASAGFYFLAVAPLFWRQPRRVAAAAGLALGYGALMGLVRMAQGGHFASDVLWSAGVCAVTSAALFFALGLDRHPPWPSAARREPALSSAELGRRSPA